MSRAYAGAPLHYRRCRICGTEGEMRLLDESFVCPRCYRAITFEIMRDESKMLTRIAREYDITRADVWEVAAMEADIMPEESEEEYDAE